MDRTDNHNYHTSDSFDPPGSSEGSPGCGTAGSSTARTNVLCPLCFDDPLIHSEGMAERVVSRLCSGTDVQYQEMFIGGAVSFLREELRRR